MAPALGLSVPRQPPGCPGTPEMEPWAAGAVLGAWLPPRLPRPSAHVSATPPALLPSRESEPLRDGAVAPIPMLVPVLVPMLVPIPPAPLTMVRAAAPGRPPVRSGAARKRLWGGRDRGSFHSPGTRPPPRAGPNPPRGGEGGPGAQPPAPPGRGRARPGDAAGTVLCCGGAGAAKRGIRGGGSSAPSTAVAQISSFPVRDTLLQC